MKKSKSCSFVSINLVAQRKPVAMLEAFCVRKRKNKKKTRVVTRENDKETCLINCLVHL